MQIVIDGILTHYEVVGDKRPPLLILHGWKRSLNEWLRLVETQNFTSLRNKYSIILLDLPGFGSTALPQKTFSIYDYALFVEHFLDKLSIKKVTLLGHSFGGRIGIIIGAKTDKIEKLILIDAAGIEKRSIGAKIKIAFFKTAKSFLPQSRIETLRNKLGSRDYKTAGPLRNIFVRVVNEDLTYLLPKIHAPTYLIWGDKDTEVAMWKTKRMRDRIPGAKLRVVWGSGHSPHLEKPEEFMGILDEYLNAK